MATASSTNDDLRGNYLDMTIIQTVVQQRTNETLDNEPSVKVATASATDVETETETSGLLQHAT